MIDPDIKELLLKDYDRLSELLIYNEETGEKRVTFFITLSTAVVGGVLTGIMKLRDLTKVNCQYPVLFEQLLVLSLAGLFSVGIIVYRRLNRRNETTDNIKNDLDHLRKTYFESWPVYKNGKMPYYIFDRRGERQQGDNNSKAKTKSTRRLTSLADIVFILNSFVFLLGAALILFDLNGNIRPPDFLFLALGAGMLVLLVFFIGSSRLARKPERANTAATEILLQQQTENSNEGV